MYELTLSVTTNGSGNATAYTTHVVGAVHSVSINKGTLPVTADITVTAEDTGEVILGLTDITTNSVDHPRALAQDTAGANIAGEYEPVFVDGRIKVVVAQGGSSNTGTLYFTVEGAGESAADASRTRTVTDPSFPGGGSV